MRSALSFLLVTLTFASRAQALTVSSVESHKVLIAHAILGSLAWAVFFPLGAIMIRVLTVKGTLWLHGGWMVFTYCMALASMGMGVWLAVAYNKLNSAHAIIGLFIICAFSIQPLTGLLHHIVYKKKRGPSIWTPLHVWWGRIIITLGGINGGLGFMLARGTPIYSHKGEIAYSVIAAVVWVAWVSIIVASEVKSRKQATGETGEKVFGSEQTSSTEEIKRERDDSHLSQYASGRLSENVDVSAPQGTRHASIV